MKKKKSLAIELTEEIIELIKEWNGFTSDAQVRQQIQAWVMRDVIPFLTGAKRK